MQPSAEVAEVSTAVLIAVGDIAGCRADFEDEATARLVDGMAGTVALLGDVVYENGTWEDFRKCYAPSWGRLLSRSRPAPGNHEYRTNEAGPYYSYFGWRAGPDRRGYYTYTHGSWRVYSLNSERNFAAQERWLRSHLASNPAKCVLAYWHKPLFTSGREPPETKMRPIFKVLYEARADIVLSGHNHNYERFAPQDHNGKAASKGIRQFVVGTGGARLIAFEAARPNSRIRYRERHGVLKLTLGPGTYDWRFVSVPGSRWTDTGSGTCS
jgi:hypothetical protein